MTDTNKVDVEPVALADDERKALERFQETTDDGEGYDVPKQMMRRLAQIGVVHHTSGGIYGITDFGHFVLGNTHSASALAELQAENKRLREACSLFVEWLDREENGFPNAGERRTTPEGQAEWREWWYGNLDLCRAAQDAARAALNGDV